MLHCGPGTLLRWGLCQVARLRLASACVIEHTHKAGHDLPIDLPIHHKRRYIIYVDMPLTYTLHRYAY